MSAANRSQTGAIDQAGSRPFGRPEVGHHDQAGVALAQILERRDRRLDASVVCHAALLLAVALERHVEVDAHEHALFAGIEVGDGLLRELPATYATAGCATETFSASSASRHE